jgi:hypothetical protein
MKPFPAYLALLLLATPASLMAAQEGQAPRVGVNDDTEGEGVVIRESPPKEVVMERADGTRIVRTGKACVSIPRYVEPWRANPFGANLAVPTNCPK